MTTTRAVGPAGTSERGWTFADLTGLMRRMTGDEKHDEAATSTMDAVWVLYDRVLRFDPERPDDPGRDRFLLSKGHGPVAFYAVLVAKGFLPEEELDRFGGFDSPLGHHPDGTLVAGAEIGSGSLGHGLPIAVGRALALRLRRSGARVFCLVGDGELDEGSNHEAIQLAGRMGLANLVVLVIDNRSASHGWPGGIARRFETEGWTSATVDGRDHDALERALSRSSEPASPPRPPHVVVAEVEPA